MFHNWFRYGDVEVASNVRVQQYVKNGLRPVGTFIGDCDDCGDLPNVVSGVDDYTTPELDLAPWVLGNDTDAGDFAGVLIKEVTGLEGSTVQVEVVEKVGDGGAIGTRRAASKVIAVTADVVGRTREATSLGLEWLGAALHPPCSPGGDCAGGVLHMFTTCPVACVGQTDPDALPVSATYGGQDEFETTGLEVSGPVVRNLILNGSMELGTPTTITNWASTSGFFFNFAEQIGSVVPPAGPATGIPNRTKVGRIQLPALTPSDNGVWVEQVVTGLTVGKNYVLSGWVYVPSATGVGAYISASGLLFGSSARAMGKDRWIYLTRTFTAENTSQTIGWGFNGGTTASGSVVYIDATMVVEDTGSVNTVSFSATGDVEGWSGTDGVDTSFTSPATIANDVAGGYLQLTWKSALDPGDNRQAAHGLVVGTAHGNIYTIEFDVFVPSGSPDVQATTLFHSHGEGPIVTTKNSWVPVRMVVVAQSSFIRYGVSTAPGQGNVGSAGRYVRIRNTRAFPGRYIPPNAYFDGASIDIPTTDLASGVAPAPLGGSSFTTGVVGSDGNVWTRITGAAATGARLTLPAFPPVNGTRYIASWEVFNDAQVPVTMAVDWCDEQVTSRVVQPGERVRIYSAGGRTYSGIYKFTDLVFGSAGEILFRDVRILPESPVDYAWTGAANASVSTAAPLGDDFVFAPDAGDNTLHGAVQGGVCDDVRVTWTVASSAGSTVNVQAGWSTSDGEVLEWGPVVQVGSSPVDLTLASPSTPRFPDDWRPVLRTILAGGGGAGGFGTGGYGEGPFGLGSVAVFRDEPPVTILGVSYTHRPVLTIEECIKPYRRTLHNVVTVEGPKVLEWLTLGDDTAGSTVARVEWTWVATDPHLWHDPMALLAGVQGKSSAAPTYQAPGVPLSGAVTASVNGTACARPAATATTCADNLLGPGITLPPQAPALADSGIMNLAGTNRTRRTFEIPIEASPIGLGKLSWRFVNDNKPKFGIRVRIWNDTLPGFLPEVECSFSEEFTIEYLAPNQTLYIDGPGDDAYVYCGDDVLGQPIYAPALKNLRGNYGGPFANSVIGCGRPYYIAVDVPNTYTSVPSDLSGLGPVSQGDVVWSVDLVRRA